MRVNRRFLGWGVFLVSIGAVLVVADLNAVDTGTIADALRLWPLAFVAIGLGIVLRRTRAGLPAGMLAAAVPGLLIGGTFAVAPRIAVDCGAGGGATTVATQQGAFSGPARVSVATGCGALVVDTATGNGWRIEAGNTGSRTPVIRASAQALSIEAGDRNGWRVFDTGRDAWRVTLPTSPLDELSLTVNAGDGRIDLARAQIGRLEVTANAAQARVDLSGASVTDLDGTINAGLLSIRLPSGSDIAGTLEVNAGSLQICRPPGLGLRLHHTDVLGGVSVNGLHVTGSDWQSVDDASTTRHADLDVNVNLGSVEIDPIGGCK